MQLCRFQNGGGPLCLLFDTRDWALLIPGTMSYLVGNSNYLRGIVIYRRATTTPYEGGGGYVGGGVSRNENGNAAANG